MQSRRLLYQRIFFNSLCSSLMVSLPGLMTSPLYGAAIYFASSKEMTVTRDFCPNTGSSFVKSVNSGTHSSFVR